MLGNVSSRSLVAGLTKESTGHPLYVATRRDGEMPTASLKSTWAPWDDESHEKNRKRRKQQILVLIFGQYSASSQKAK